MLNQAHTPPAWSLDDFDFVRRDASPRWLVPWDRFDIMIKWAHGSYFLEHASKLNAPETPQFISDVYLEHERVWNHFSERCPATTKRSHPNCTAKCGASAFVGVFHTMLLSMRAQGFSAELGGAIPACSRPGSTTAYALNGAHRVAAAIAAGLPSMPVDVHDGGKPCNEESIASRIWDWQFFAKLGYRREYADWVVARAIKADASLFVVHLWPVAARVLDKRLTINGRATIGKMVRRTLASACSTENGVLYEKEVSLSSRALGHYLRHSYGDVPWLATKHRAVWAAEAPTRVFVVRSTSPRMDACKEELRRRLHPHLRPADFKASVHATSHHSEAVGASRILLNDNSIAHLNSATDAGFATCWRVANSVLGTDLSLVAKHATRKAVPVATPPPPAQQQGALEPLPALVAPATAAMPLTRGHATTSTDTLLPEDFLLDTGAAMALYGLRDMTDIDLIWEPGRSAAAELVEVCGRHPGRLCQGHYGSHMPPVRGYDWFRFHNSSAGPEELLHDPRRHAYCAGLKMVALPQLLAYKRQRLRARGETKDARDVGLIERVLGVNATR
jgi:hypothetical protein